MSIRSKYADPVIEQSVLEKTAELLGERGIRSWNVDELALKTGLAKNTLYRIIGSKEEIVKKAVLFNIKSTQFKILAVIGEEADYGTAFHKLIELFPILINNAQTGAMHEVFLQYPSIEKAVKEHYDRITESIVDFFIRGRDEGYLRKDLDPMFLFEMLQTFMLGFIRRGCSSDELSRKIGLAMLYLTEGVRV